MAGFSKHDNQLDKIFSVNKPSQLWINAQRFEDHLRLHHQGNDDIIPLLLMMMMMEAEMVSETLVFCPQMTRLVARKNFIEFSRRETSSIIR
jgi:hypothetical protein